MKQLEVRVFYVGMMWQVYQVIYSKGLPYRIFLTEDGSDGWDTYVTVGKDDFSLMWPIGICDREGTIIYEDDILNFNEDVWGGKFIPEVVPSVESIIKGNGLSGTISDISNYRKVIGNIHENPEIECVRVWGRNYE